ncbi:MAG: hypothetical protein RDV41_03615 [Planctomycetota bacterium]|nr:hypothetical protein [Planctomycetota bacterium]
MNHLPPIVFYFPICLVIFTVHAIVKEETILRMVKRSLKNSLLFTLVLAVGCALVTLIEKVG